MCNDARAKLQTVRAAAVQKMNPIFHSVIINISLQMVLIFYKCG